MSFSHILIAMDGSPTSFDAVRRGLDLAAALAAEARTLHVVEPPVPYSSEFGLPPDELLQVATRESEAVVATLRRAVSIPEETPYLVRVGRPADVILDVAREWPTDLIVIGSHGRSGVARVLLGSVAESVVRRAPCPVLIVPRDDKRTAKPSL